MMSDQKIKEEDIRPTDVFDEYLRLSASDIGKYFSDLSTRIYRKCPGCGKDTAAPVFEKNDFSFMQCLKCKTLYANPCPAPEQLALFYNESPSQKFWAGTFFPVVAQTRREKIFRPRAKKIKELYHSHISVSGKIIDVGAGAGTMLDELRACSTGDNYLAIEPTPELAKICRLDGLDTFEGFADDAAKDKALIESASMVMSFEVIEHVISPVDFITDLKSLCMPGGLILVTGLCGSGFDIKILGQNSKAVSPPHHLNFLSRVGVSKLLERCGLEEVSFTTPGVLDVDIVLNHFKKEPADINDIFISYLLELGDEVILEDLQQFITNNNLSSHMWFLARKPF